MLPCVVAGLAPGEPDAGQIFGVADEAQPFGDELPAQARRGELVAWRGVAGDALRRAGEHRQIIRLARVRLAVHVLQRRALFGELAEVRRLKQLARRDDRPENRRLRPRAEDVGVVAILLDNDDNMIKPGEPRSKQPPWLENFA